jgi:hypothetical protein
MSCDTSRFPYLIVDTVCRHLVLFAGGHSTVSLKYHAASWCPLPPGAVCRGPQHGFSKNVYTTCQCLPPGTPYSLALFAGGHSTVSLITMPPPGASYLPALFTGGHSTVSLKYHAASWYLLPPGAVYRGPQHGFKRREAALNLHVC